MRIILVHREGPGQFRHLAERLAADGAAVTMLAERQSLRLPGVRTLTYAPAAQDGARPLPALAAKAVETGTAVADVLAMLARREGPPDLMLGHPGWGGLLFAADALPDTPIVAYCEYFYRLEGGDVGFDPSEPVTGDTRRRIRLRNMIQLAALDAATAGIAPTGWQRSLYPAQRQPRIAVAHEGIDTGFCRPDPTARLTLPDGRTVAAGDPVVTFAARSLEPHRGFPSFMRAAAIVARRRQDALFLVAGQDEVTYSRPPAGGGSWRELLEAEAGIDPARFVFLGALPHRHLVRLMQVSAAHVYLTVPFVLSWSMLEAMAAGALVIGSATPPVEEVISDGRNGLLAGFFDAEGIAERIVSALAAPDRFTAIRAEARATIVARYGLEDCLRRQVAVLDRVRAGRRSAGAAFTRAAG